MIEEEKINTKLKDKQQREVANDLPNKITLKPRQMQKEIIGWYFFVVVLI